MVSVVQTQVVRIVGFRGYYIPHDSRPDVTQEVMLGLWQALCRPDFQLAETFNGFVGTVVQRRCVDWMREHRQAKEVPSPPSTTHESPVFERNVIAADLCRRVLRRLSEACRELICLREKENLSWAEIAERLGRSRGALRVQMHDCVERAREIRRQLSRRPILPVRHGES